ncbi:MAG TPA: hypothetical protein VF658_00005 [Pyrinomonadaceae bacterium]|jgi:hypothetical protein
MKVTLFTILAMLLILSSVYAQGWRVYSPPNTNYSIESPVPFHRVRYYEGEHGIGDAWTTKEEARGSIVYVAQQSSPKLRDYAVLVADIPKERRPLSVDDIDYLKWWIGGDDESEPTDVIDVEVHGLKGKEYIYAKAISLDRYTRGRIFDGGDKVYILIFKSSTAEDLSSNAATRFLNSFRLRKKTGKVK